MRTLPPAAALAALLAVAPDALAQAAAAVQRGPAPAVGQVSPGQPPLPSFDQNAEETREQLRQILDRYPPNLRVVLRYDPTLLNNAAYLAPYPGLAAFLAQHPEVAHNPLYFVGGPQTPYESNRGEDPASVRARVAGEALAMSLVFFGVMAVVGVIGWVLKMLVDHRRWLRISKVQTEAHTKLLDRLASNEDLMAYIQTSAGKRFLESAPSLVAPAQAPTAPLGRILLSVQIGTVATLIGSGLLFLSRRLGGDSASELYEFGPVFFMFGIVVLSAGAGFIISAAVSFVLSKQLGLFASSPGSSNA
jgi:hypothetical protein